MKQKLTGAEILIQCLQSENVEYIFGYPGGQALNIYDALFRQDKIKHILVRHEQAATHAADAYSRSSNKVGVTLVTSGPGVTNTITGIATAYMDSIPMIVISGQVPTHFIGEDAFQECDAVGISRPCVKHNFLIKDVKDIPQIVKKAFYLATSGRPGPVLIDIPKDVTAAQMDFDVATDYPKSVEMRSYNPVNKGHLGQIRKAVQLIENAKQPLIYFGGGIVLANAENLLTNLVEKLNLPITSTLMGLGGFPADKPQWLGMLGMHGTYEANNAMQYADVILALGARFDDRVIGNIPDFMNISGRTIIHVDIDPSSISKRVKADIPIVGNVKDVLEDILEILQSSKQTPNYQSWWNQIQIWRERDSLNYRKNQTCSENEILPQFVVEKLYEITNGDVFVTSDVGQHQMFAAQYYRFNKPRRWINSGGLGTMGVGLPYAMGVCFANQNADLSFPTVACITGEGSIQMNIQELSTCKQCGLPIKIINLNNGMLGMVRQWQEMFYSRRYSASYVSSLPDFVKLAEAYGHKGIRIENPADVVPALEKAFFGEFKNDLVFLDFVIKKEANVYPMIPAGKGLTDMVLGEK